LSKTILFSNNKKHIKEVKATSGFVFKEILILLHPFIPFITEELWLKNKLGNKKEKYLVDFNLKSIKILLEMLQINLEYDFTNSYQENYSSMSDYRINSENFNSNKIKIDKYTQVFQSKHGFINNLSVLDLIFNEGPNAINFLKTS